MYIFTMQGYLLLRDVIESCIFVFVWGCNHVIFWTFLFIEINHESHIVTNIHSVELCENCLVSFFLFRIQETHKSGVGFLQPEVQWQEDCPNILHQCIQYLDWPHQNLHILFTSGCFIVVWKNHVIGYISCSLYGAGKFHVWSYVSKIAFKGTGRDISWIDWEILRTLQLVRARKL